MQISSIFSLKIKYDLLDFGGGGISHLPTNKNKLDYYLKGCY